MTSANHPHHLIEKTQQALHRTLPNARIEIQSLPLLAEQSLRLGLINADFPLGPLPPEVMHAVIANPAYWSFCWGSGLSMARWLLTKPELVAGKRVADVGCGSGVVAIAAAQAGAAAVIACDNDADALTATAMNAALNEVQLELLDDVANLDQVDLILMADVLYDRSNFALINIAKQHAEDILIADSRVSDVEDGDFRIIHRDEELTLPNLGEFDEFRYVSFFARGLDRFR